MRLVIVCSALGAVAAVLAVAGLRDCRRGRDRARVRAVTLARYEAHTAHQAAGAAAQLTEAA